MASNLLTYQGVSVQAAYDKLATAGIQPDVAQSIIGLWIGEAVRGGRHFGYAATLAPADPGPPFARSFEHQDWTDGESTVQAGETPTEQGFNHRFHRIEDDLDRLGALVAGAAVDAADLRGTLVGALREIAAELNRLNADVAELRRGRPGPATATTVDPGFAYVGRTRYFDGEVMVFRDRDGRLINVPEVRTLPLPPSAGTRAPQVAEVLGRDDDIREAMTGAFTTREMVSRFGERLTSDGQPLRKVLESLPGEQVFASADAMVDALAAQDVALLKGLGSDAVVRGSLGVGAAEPTATAAVTRLEGVAPALGEALVEAGVRTVGELAALSPERLIAIGAGANVALDRGVAARLLVRGRVFGGI